MTSISSSRIESISELLQTGRTSFDPDRVRYVCHTSTIPLATTVDEQNLLKDREDCVEVTHSIKYQPGYEAGIDYRCCLKHCMYTNSRFADMEILRGNCPCGRIVRTEFMPDGEEVDVYLQPLCFLQVLKELRYKFGYTDVTECDSDAECCHNDNTFGSRSNRPKIDLADVMFCQNSQSITDGAYSRPLRDRVGFSGWDAIREPEQLAAVLDTLYWYRKYVGKSTRKFLGYHSEKFRDLKQAVSQALHTINGQIVQKFLLFPVEMEGYTDLAKLTSGLFESLIRDYLKAPGDEPSAETSIFLHIKEVKKKVKQSFPSENADVRYSVFDLILRPAKQNNFSRFWGKCFRRLQRRIEGLDDDFTTSPAWIYIMGGFSQTRNLGYLPPWVAEPARKKFRQTVGRDKVVVPKDDLLLIYKLIQKQMYEAGIERGFLSTQNRESNPDFREVITHIRIPLKPSASNLSTVSQGGKVEDARVLLSTAIANAWRVPTRDFETGCVMKWIQFDHELRVMRPEYEEWLFWAALQVLLNWFGRKFAKYKDFVIELPGSEYLEDTLWKMQIVHISEPGKERNLTKTSSIVSWVLTLASKVSQSVLSFAQDHRAGLILSAQDWMHQRRVSAESYESFWMYEQSTRRRFDGVWNGFQDWTESTDFIPRQVGGVALQAWFAWIDFPRWFGDLVFLVTQRDYAVTELLSSRFEDGLMTRNVYEGRVSEGFMMSMPLTKTILHLMHDVNVGLVHTLLRLEGVSIAKRPDQLNPDVTRSLLGAVSILPEHVG